MRKKRKLSLKQALRLEQDRLSRQGRAIIRRKGRDAFPFWGRRKK